MKIAANRPEPIPVYAEMSSINPVFLMPNKLAKQAKSVASGFVASLAMGAGQFCTNPGMLVLLDGEGANDFLAQVAADTEALFTQTMLTAGIYQAYCDGVNALAANDKVTLLAKAKASNAPNQCQAHVFVTDAVVFLSDKSLESEVFGSNSLIIKCQNIAEYSAVAEHLEGQLTATIQMEAGDIAEAATLLPILERKVGRLLCNGYPTGVEVCQAMVHGGPFPATSDSRSTSVGSAAIDRFVRPVCYQDFPEALMPLSVQDANPLSIPQLVDGVLTMKG
jgi:NADP-dependent aldehyde dehydrogenase